MAAIKRGENREEFKQVIENLPDFAGGKAEVARSRICHTMDEIRAAADELGLPVVLRPSYTMGGVVRVSRTMPASWNGWAASAWTPARSPRC